MKLYGIQKLTLLDFPGKTACTVFTSGCDMRCPFCHNGALARGEAGEPLDEGDLFAFLEKRRGVLDGVCVSGGEPTLSLGLDGFLRRVRELGYLTKLDTNGCHPDVLRRLIGEGLLDYVAMDIKSSPEGYAVAAGIDGFDMGGVRESIALLLEGRVDYEFRTTVVKGLHGPEDIAAAAKSIEGAERYYLQSFVDPGDLAVPEFSAFSSQEMHEMLTEAAKYVKYAGLRGV